MDADQNVDLVQQLFFPVPGRPALVLPCLNQVCVSQSVSPGRPALVLPCLNQVCGSQSVIPGCPALVLPCLSRVFVSQSVPVVLFWCSLGSIRSVAVSQ